MTWRTGKFQLSAICFSALSSRVCHTSSSFYLDFMDSKVVQIRELVLFLNRTKSEDQ